MAAPTAPNPQLDLPGDDNDKLSDYIPMSNEVSRAPSKQVSTRGSDAEDELENEDEAAYVDEDGDVPMDGSPAKSRKEEVADAKKAASAGRRAVKHDRESGFAARKEAQASLKSADSIKRFAYLLGQTDLFRHFCDLKAERDPEFAAMLAESEKQLGKGKATAKRKGAANGAHGRKSEKEEDDELLAATKAEEADEVFTFTESPAYVKGGQMRDYQVQGLNWMVGLHHNGINGILADEMGLGKTLQTISFLGYLKFQRGISGPHLVIVPKSTLDNWHREFDRWVPGFKVTMLRGGKEERAETVENEILTESFDVLITSYELCLREKSALKKLSWEYIVIDEAHRIKNVDSMLSQIVRAFDSRGRLLITGTPLQNNLHELWALLNFLLPDVFSDIADFDAWFERQAPKDLVDGEDAHELTEEEKAAASNNVVKQLHAVLRPFLLRRVKADVEKSLLPKKEINVYVGMTDLQRKWYKMILEKDIDAVNGAGGKKEGKTRLQNIVMQLRKCCNHPYLFDGAEPGPPFTTDEHLVEAAGKMKVLDKLLKSMKAKGSRVLIFSQMSRVLDILEDYCHFREYNYCRLDGSTSHDDRMDSIDAYNAPDSDKFIFLLTTRAGGLGINLVSADIVVLYDSDWNPQADLQAMDRAHRIGQKKQVYVFRFVTENAVEEKVLERAAQKLRLDQLVIQQGRAEHKSKTANKDELVDMIQHGAEKIINSKESMDVQGDIDEIIRQGEERTAELNSRYAQLNFDDLQIFKSETTTQWEGEEYGGKKKQGILWIEPSKRERKSNYSVDEYYRGAMHRGAGAPGPKGPRGPRGPKQTSANDFQFFPPRLVELQERELLAHRKSINFVVPPSEDQSDPDAAEAERLAEQEAVNSAEPLTEEEVAEKEALAELGFSDWNKRDFQAFIRGCELYGREDLASVATEVTTKTYDEVAEYSSVFWERYTEIDDHERQIRKIEDAENRRAQDARLTQMIADKVNSVAHPLQQLKIVYANQTKGKSYSEDEDRFLLVELAKYGVGKEDTFERIKRDINEFPAFLMDWFFKSRTPQEIGRRCNTLVSLVDREINGTNDDTAADGDDEERGTPKVESVRPTSGRGSRGGRGRGSYPSKGTRGGAGGGRGGAKAKRASEAGPGAGASEGAPAAKKARASVA